MDENDVRERTERYFRAAMAIFVFVLVLAVYFGAPDPAGDIKRLLISVCAFGFAMWWAAVVWWNKYAIRRPPLFPGLMLVFLLLYAVGVTHSEFRHVALIESGGFFSLVILYFVASQVYRTSEQVVRLLWVICTAVGVASLYGLLQKTGLDPMPWADRGSDVYTNLPATFGNPNFAAHVLVIAIPLACFLAVAALSELRGGWSKQRLLLAVLPLGLLLLFFAHLHYTGQRAGLIALAASAMLLLTALALGRRFRKPILGAACSLLLVAVIGVGGIGGGMAVAKWRTGVALPLDSSLLVRYQSYVSAANMLFDRPLLGHGPGMYAVTYSDYWTPFEKDWFAQELRVNDHVHNDLIEVALDAGLPAAGVYLSLLVLGMGYALVMAFTSTARLRRRLGYAMAAVFAAFLVDGLFGFNLRVPVSAALLFILFGLLEGLCPGTETRRTTRWLPWTVAIVALFFAVLGARVFGAQYYLQQGARAQAVKSYAKAGGFYAMGSHLTPWDWQFPRRRGLTFLAQSDPQAALPCLEEALALNPYYLTTRLPLAHAKMQLAQRAMATEPDKPEKALRMLDDAARQMDEFLKVCPNFTDAHELLGRIASLSAVFVSGGGTPEALERAQGYWKTAEEHLVLAVRFAVTKKSEQYRMLAKVRMALNEVEGAEQALGQAAQADPKDSETWPLMIEFANKHKRFDQVRNTFYAQLQRLKEEAAPDDKALGTLYMCLANVLENGYNDDAGVAKAFQSAWECIPGRPELWTNLARYAFDKNHVDLLRVAVAQSSGQAVATDKDKDKDKDKEQDKNSTRKPLPYVTAVNSVLQQGPRALESATTVLLSHVRAHKQGGALTAVQQYGWAARMLLDALKSAPADTPGICTAGMNLGIIEVGFGDAALADQLFSQAKACVDAAHEPFMAVYWADALVQLKRNGDALTQLLEAKAKYPANFDVRWALARTLVKEGRNGEARSEYESLIQEKDLTKEAKALLAQEMKGL